MDSGGVDRPRRISRRSRTVPSPIARIGCATVVSGGSMHRANRMSSNPTTERSTGTRSPLRFAVSMTPIAISSLKQKMAVGEFLLPRSRSAPTTPDSIEKSPFTTKHSRSALCFFEQIFTPRSRSRLSGLASGPVITPIRRWPKRERWSIASTAAFALSMWTLGTPS